MLKTDTSQRPRVPVAGIGAAILLAALLVRLIGIDGRWMWYDELMSATFVAHDMPQTLLANLRFDVHPPLYYIQLNLWTLLGQGDLWMQLNSVLWSVLAVWLLIWRTRQLYDMRTAWMAGALLAFSGAALAYGDQVRMYTFLMVAILWAWIAMDDWMQAAREDRLSWKTSLNLIAGQLAVVYSHSAGIVMISGVVLYGAVMMLRDGGMRTRVRWVALETAVVVLALPALALGAFRTVTHTVAPALGDILQTWRFLAAGELAPQMIGAVMGVVLLAVLVWFALAYRPQRIGLLTLVFAPLLVAAVVSYVKPIWLDRIFTPVIPFICLYVGVFASSLMKRWRIGGVAVVALLAVLWSSVGVWGQMTREKGDGFKPAAAYVHTTAGLGDTVLVDDDVSYWCFMWYFAGPRWGYPQQAATIMPKWQDLMDRLGPEAAKLLGFNEQMRSVDVNGLNAVMWDRATPVAITSNRVMAVRKQNAPVLDLPGFKLAASHSEKNLVIETWERTLAP